MEPQRRSSSWTIWSMLLARCCSRVSRDFGIWVPPDPSVYHTHGLCAQKKETANVSLSCRAPRLAGLLAYAEFHSFRKGADRLFYTAIQELAAHVAKGGPARLRRFGVATVMERFTCNRLRIVARQHCLDVGKQAIAYNSQPLKKASSRPEIGYSSISRSARRRWLTSIFCSAEISANERPNGG